MIAEVEQPDGTFVDKEREPRCGDFCDRCPHCLTCFPDDSECLHPDGHKWVIRIPPPWSNRGA